MHWHETLQSSFQMMFYQNLKVSHMQKFSMVMRRTKMRLLLSKSICRGSFNKCIILLMFCLKVFLKVLSKKHSVLFILFMLNQVKSYGLIMMMMMMKNCFCGMVDQRTAFSLICCRDNCQRSSPLRVSDTPRAAFV